MRARVAALLLAGTAAIIAVFLRVQPLPQWPAYHEFADRRAFLGVANFLNAASNAPLHVIAIVALARLARGGLALRQAAERWPWAMFFLAVVLLVWLFPPRYSRGGDVLAVQGLYALAPVAEWLDHALHTLTGWLSGHTLKHLVAAGAAYLALRMLHLRPPRPAMPGERGSRAC